MKDIKLLIVSISLVLAHGCTEKHEPYVSILTDKDTVEVNEGYLAEVYLENYSDSLATPLFYVISSRNDTTLLPYDEEKGCAIFSASGSRIGKIEWRGFVDLSENSNYDNIEFEKAFYIKAE